MPEQYYVSCPMDCFDLCRFIVRVRNNQIVSLKGDPDHPLTRGVVCPKARHLIRRHNHPRRILTPMIRTATGFDPVSYDRVLDLMADRLTRVMSESGPASILNYASGGYGGMKNRIQSIFFNTLGGDTRFSGSLCWSAGMAAQTYDFGRAMGHNPLDVLNSDLVIVWGRNPRVTNIHLHALLNRARKKGTEVVVIDPVSTPTAKGFDCHIRIAPGTDGALALAMCHVLIREDLVDMPFIRDHVKGFKRFKAALRDFTPELAEAVTNIPERQIRELAVRYGRTPKAAIFIGYGMQRYENGGNAVRSIDALAALSGHIGQSGSGVNYAAKSLAPFLGAPEKKSFDRVKTRRQFPAPCLGSFLAKVQDPPILAAFFSYGNPLVQTPDLNLALKGIEKVPFKVVFDQFMTDTACRADLVLPAATVFEQEDIFVTSMFSHIINFSQQAVAPPHALMSEFDFFLELARRMGLDLGFSSSRDYLDQCAAPLIAELNRINPVQSLDLGPLDLESLVSAYARHPEHDIAWQSLNFSTPSGKIEIFSDLAMEDGQSPLPVFTPPVEPPDGFPLRLLTCHTGDSMHSQGFMDRDRVPSVSLHPDTAGKYCLADGARVRVVGENGEIEAAVQLDRGVYKNTAFMFQGYWHKSGAVNFLTRERVSDMGNQAAYYDSFCRLTAL